MPLSAFGYAPSPSAFQLAADGPTPLIPQDQPAGSVPLRSIMPDGWRGRPVRPDNVIEPFIRNWHLGPPANEAAFNGAPQSTGASAPSSPQGMSLDTLQYLMSQGVPNDVLQYMIHAQSIPDSGERSQGWQYPYAGMGIEAQQGQGWPGAMASPPAWPR